MAYKIVRNFFSKFHHNGDIKSKFIFYKIVDFRETSKTYILQCVNTKAIFYAGILEIVFDLDVLYGLHPLQACYVGMEYSENFFISTCAYKAVEINFSKYSVNRYGIYNILGQNRSGAIIFQNKCNQRELVNMPLEVAHERELIIEFDAAQAFYIGLCAGIQLKHLVRQNAKDSKPNYLKLVK